MPRSPWQTERLHELGPAVPDDRGSSGAGASGARSETPAPARASERPGRFLTSRSASWGRMSSSWRRLQRRASRAAGPDFDEFALQKRLPRVPEACAGRLIVRAREAVPARTLWRPRIWSERRRVTAGHPSVSSADACRRHWTRRCARETVVRRLAAALIALNNEGAKRYPRLSADSA
jgi:hypothetical protein